MGAISGFAAEPYSYTSLRDVQAASVAACLGGVRGGKREVGAPVSRSSLPGAERKQNSTAATLVKKAAREFHESRQLADTWPECVESVRGVDARRGLIRVGIAPASPPNRGEPSRAYHVLHGHLGGEVFVHGGGRHRRVEGAARVGGEKAGER